jgi:hypothetical protein
MVLVKATEDSEAGVMPSEEILTEMGKYNEELAKAGVLLAGEGLQPSSKGARVKFSGNQRIVTDGPFAETKELIAGFWLWQVKSLDETIEWLKRAPFKEGEVEIRQVFRHKTSAMRSRLSFGSKKHACARRPSNLRRRPSRKQQRAANPTDSVCQERPPRLSISLRLD